MEDMWYANVLIHSFIHVQGTMASDVFDNIISAGVPCDEWNTYIESTLSKSLDKEQ